MGTIQLRHIDRCTLNPAGLVRIENLGGEAFVLGHGYCFYAPNPAEAERVYRLVRESIRDSVELSSLNCDRCNLDLLEDQIVVMLGEDICCPRCGVLNPSEVLHDGSERVELDKELALAILLREHMGLCLDDHDEVETILRDGCIGLDNMSKNQILNELVASGLMDTYETELAERKGG